MSPILYESRETDFNHNGLGKMNETLSAIVTEVANGEFELEVVYPIGGRLYEYIQDHMLIKAKPNSVDEPHVFRIYEHVIDTVGQTVTIYAHTKSNDLGQNLVKDVVITSLTPQEAMDSMKMNLVEPTDYSFVSDITTRSSTEWKNRNPLNCIAGEEGSLIHYWGGEIKRDNRTVYLYRRRGRDNVAIIRDGKNINGLSLEYSTKGMVTKIIPYRTYTPEDSDDEVVEYGTPVESQYIGNYPLVYVRAIDYSNDDDVTSLETMNTKANRYFTENNGVDKPSVNVSMGLVELSDSSEYEKFKDFENVELFDTVTVYSKQYDIHIEAKITTLVYDSLAGKNISLEMGSYRTGLIESTERTYMELIGEKEAKLIQTIQVAANGKNRVFRGVTEPTTGMVKNDIWYQPVGAGETMMYVFDGAYWQLNKVSTGLLSGTLDAENGDVNLINVNVANIVGETSSFVQSSWNNISTQISIDNRGINIIGSDQWRRTYFRDIGFDFFNGSSANNKAGAIGYFKNHIDISSPNENVMSTGIDRPHVLGIGANLYHDVALGYNPNISQERIFQPALRVRGDTGDVHFYTRFTDGGTSGNYLSLDASPVKDRPGMTIRNDNSKLNRLHFGDFSLHMEATSNIDFWTESKNTMTLRDVIHARTNIQMNGNDVVGNSDERLKKNIVDSNLKALDYIDTYNFVEFEWKDGNRPEGKHFGLIAQNTPFISEVDNDDVWNINLSKQTMLTTKGVQELHQELKETKQELADLKALLAEKGVI